MKITERQTTLPERSNSGRLDSAWLKQLALDQGADDAGLVEIGHPALDDQRADILKFYPRARALLAIVCRMNREPIRNPARSVANLEFHSTGEEVNDVCRSVVAALEREGIAAINPPMGFPMESDRWPEKMWVVSHKPVAVAAGLGMMGIHRNVIHPKFGNFILLGTVLIGVEATEYDRPIDYNPCLSCKLCVAACPVGAISPDGRFDLASCYAHNYREFMGGFGDWVEQVADAKNGLDLRKKSTRQETVSVWQSLAFGPNYKAAYCLSVCPAGEDVIGPFKANRKGFLDEIVKPLQEKEETIYVVPKSDAEDHVKQRFPHKSVKHVRGSLLPRTIAGFLSGMPHTFQRGQSEGLNAVFHFTFIGNEPRMSLVGHRHGYKSVTWADYQKIDDPILTEIDESFFEIAHLFADMMAVDGALILTKRFEVVGFGGEVLGERPVGEVFRALDLEGTITEREQADSSGTRHRSAYRFVSEVPESLAIVISQDGAIRFVTGRDERVVYWPYLP